MVYSKALSVNSLKSQTKKRRHFSSISTLLLSGMSFWNTRRSSEALPFRIFFFLNFIFDASLLPR